MNLNKVMLIGNLTRDPELRTTPNGLNVASFAIATNRVWTDQSGQKQEKAEFHNIVAWRKLADICSQYLKKGAKIYAEGYLQTRDWTGEDGVKRYRTEIVLENMIMLDRPGGASNFNAPQNTQTPSQNEAPVISADEPVQSPTGEAEEEEIKVENIPF